MKFFIVVCSLVAVALTAPAREKRGFLSGLHSAGIYSDYSAPILTLSAPAAKLVTVNKVVDTHHVVDVPQVVNVRKVVSIPQVVSVNKVVASPSYISHNSGFDAAYESGWSSSISHGW